MSDRITKTIGLKKLRKIENLVSSVKEVSAMERSNFENLPIDEDHKMPINEEEVTEFIRKRTKLWRDSWIIQPLEKVLEILRNEVE